MKTAKGLLYTSLSVVLSLVVLIAINNLWIDNLSTVDFPNRVLLRSSRLVWNVSPAIIRESDARRALKLSWLTVSSKVNRKGEKDIPEILRELESEVTYLASYLTKYVGAVDKTTRSMFASQILTYLNRIELHRVSSDTTLSMVLNSYTPELLGTATTEMSYAWYREQMIRAALHGDKKQYESNRSSFERALKSDDSTVPQNFRQGMLLYYDAVIACINRKPEEATHHLLSASESVAAEPRLLTNFLRLDLNVLLLGKAMEEPQCRRELRKFILKGE